MTMAGIIRITETPDDDGMGCPAAAADDYNNYHV
jgi:hypothetical protein